MVFYETVMSGVPGRVNRCEYGAGLVYPPGQVLEGEYSPIGDRLADSKCYGLFILMDPSNYMEVEKWRGLFGSKKYFTKYLRTRTDKF
jgi:hypothetical protein